MLNRCSQMLKAFLPHQEPQKTEEKHIFERENEDLRNEVHRTRTNVISSFEYKY